MVIVINKIKYILSTCTTQYSVMHHRNVPTFCKTITSSSTHAQVPYKDDYQSLFRGLIDGAGVGDVQYASVSLLEGTRGGAQVMLDLAGDHCQPPTDDQLKVSWMAVAAGRLDWAAGWMIDW